MERIEITNQKSMCCKAFIQPYCSNCGEFPKASFSALKKALEILNKQDNEK